jgi:ribosomal protein S18 acetylase RimI-like enzyme
VPQGRSQCERNSTGITDVIPRLREEVAGSIWRATAFLRENASVIRRGSFTDFDAAAALSGNAELLRWRWQVPSFDPSRHLWIADGAFGVLYAPDEAVVRGNAVQMPALLERNEQQARAEGFPQLMFVIPEWDKPAWRAYERAGFALTTEVLELEVNFDDAPPEPSPPDDVTLRTYTDADAHAVRELLDDAYTGWDETYVPFTHDDWLAFMTDHNSFDPACWFLAEVEGQLAGVCLTWKEGWIKDLAVAPSARGRGLGESLLRHAFGRLYGRGARRVGLKVDAHNPTSALRLYERVGMRVVKRYRSYVKKL